eukprot:2228317-Lingulodinium_polyedra.AAC.1
MDRSGWWQAASRDALARAPVPMGNKRARRLDPALLQAMGSTMAEGTWARTPGRLVAAMARFRHWRVRR